MIILQKKIKKLDKIIYTISFNYTNIEGIVLYDNTIIISGCKKIIQSFTNFINGKLFLDNNKNEVTTEAINSENSKMSHDIV